MPTPNLKDVFESSSVDLVQGVKLYHVSDENYFNVIFPARDLEHAKKIARALLDANAHRINTRNSEISPDYKASPTEDHLDPWGEFVADVRELGTAALCIDDAGFQDLRSGDLNDLLDPNSRKFS